MNRKDEQEIIAEFMELPAEARRKVLSDVTAMIMRKQVRVIPGGEVNAPDASRPALSVVKGGRQ